MDGSQCKEVRGLTGLGGLVKAGGKADRITTLVEDVDSACCLREEGKIRKEG